MFCMATKCTFSTQNPSAESFGVKKSWAFCPDPHHKHCPWAAVGLPPFYHCERALLCSSFGLVDYDSWIHRRMRIHLMCTMQLMVTLLNAALVQSRSRRSTSGKDQTMCRILQVVLYIIFTLIVITYIYLFNFYIYGDGFLI